MYKQDTKLLTPISCKLIVKNYQILNFSRNSSALKQPDLLYLHTNSAILIAFLGFFRIIPNPFSYISIASIQDANVFFFVALLFRTIGSRLCKTQRQTYSQETKKYFLHHNLSPCVLFICRQQMILLTLTPYKLINTHKAFFNLC